MTRATVALAFYPETSNLRQIDGAIQQWALETGALPTAPVTGANIKPYMGRGVAGLLPWCPLDPAKVFASSYTVVDASTPPVCQKLPGGDASGNFKHVLPQKRLKIKTRKA